MSLAACFIALAPASSASPADDVVRQVFNAYLEVCEKAFADPSTYLDALQVPGPSGERVVSRTPDERVTWIVTSKEDLLEDVRFADLPGMRHTNCVFTKTMTSPVTNGPDLNAALKAFLEDRPDVNLVGGNAPQDQPMIVFGAGNGIAPIGDSHVFVASGLFPGLDVITQIEAHTSYLAVSGILNTSKD